MGRSRNVSRDALNSASCSRTLSRIPSFSNTLMLARATAALTGCPANVMPCRKLDPEERLDDPVAHGECTHWRVPAGESLGHGDHVGHVVVALGAEEVAEATPGADDLVGDEQDAVAVADLAHPLEVAGWRGEAAAGV